MGKRSKAKPKAVMSTELNWGGVAIANIIADSLIAGRMATVGFTASRLAAAHDLFVVAGDKLQRQVAAVGAYHEATEAVRKTRKAAMESYQGLSKAARNEFRKERAILAELGLDGPMPSSLPTFLTMALAAFTNVEANPAIAARMAANYNYTPERLASERAAVEALIEARRQQEAAKGAAQQATAEQDAAMSAFRAEMSALRSMAKQALRDQPQLLEKIGISLRTIPTSKQRHAGQKAAATRKAKAEKKEKAELVPA